MCCGEMKWECVCGVYEMKWECVCGVVVEMKWECEGVLWRDEVGMCVWGVLWR